MTYSEHISNLRNTIRAVSGDSDFTNSYLYSIWKIGRAKFLAQKAKRKNHIAHTNKHLFCLELKPAKSHDCSCVTVGCDVLKTVHEIPAPISSYTRSIMKVMTLDGTIIPYRTEAEVKSAKLDPIKSGSLGYVIYNNRLVVWNTLELKALQVEAIWADPLAWQDIQYCGSDSIPCIDVMEMQSGLSEEDEDPIIRNSLELLGIPLKIQADASQDSNPDIK
jgi:hypothetical protein